LEAVSHLEKQFLHEKLITPKILEESDKDSLGSRDEIADDKQSLDKEMRVVVLNTSDYVL